MTDDYIKFGDVDSRDYYVRIFPANSDDAPDNDPNEIEIPGRNGSLLLRNKRFPNLQQSYTGIIYDDAVRNFELFRNELMRERGYQRLCDHLHPDEFYEAYHLGGIEPEFAVGRDMVKFTISFSRKPQRFLVIGDEQLTMPSNSWSLFNPTPFDAKPMIRITGSGNIVFGGKTITIASHSNAYIDIDCEMMDCYCGAVNCNSLVTISDYDFPVLKAGLNNITKTVPTLKIIPRWWRV